MILNDLESKVNEIDIDQILINAGSADFRNLSSVADKDTAKRMITITKEIKDKIPNTSNKKLKRFIIIQK